MNGFELLGRERKALRMSDELFDNGISSEVVKNFTDEQWEMVRLAAKNKPCKGGVQPCTHCREKTLEFLQNKERRGKR